MRKIKSLIYVFSCILLILLYGCATTYKSHSYDKDSSRASLDVAPILQFDDVPVPAGFNLLSNESFAFQNDVTRVALLKYIGGRPVDQIVAFYKDQMLLYNWQPLNIVEYERRILNYEKESESCIVTIEPSGRKVLITIWVSPKSRPMKVEVDK